MEKESEGLDGGTSRTTRIIGYSLAGGLFGFVCAVAPFGLGLSRTRRFSLIPKLEPGIEDPHRLATRALMWGTFYSVSGVGSLTVGVCWLLGVKNVRCVFYIGLIWSIIEARVHYLILIVSRIWSENENYSTSQGRENKKNGTKDQTKGTQRLARIRKHTHSVHTSLDK